MVPEQPPSAVVDVGLGPGVANFSRRDSTFASAS
jgi:hypothetical protein